MVYKNFIIFDNFLIMYVVKGDKILTINNKAKIIEENDVMIVNFYEEHRYETNASLDALWW